MIPCYALTLLQCTKTDDEPNGMKLAFEFLLYQLLTQYLPGFDH
jgi:hypothetical protein